MRTLQNLLGQAAFCKFLKRYNCASEKVKILSFYLLHWGVIETSSSINLNLNTLLKCKIKYKICQVTFSMTQKVFLHITLSHMYIFFLHNLLQQNSTASIKIAPVARNTNSIRKQIKMDLS